MNTYILRITGVFIFCILFLSSFAQKTFTVADSLYANGLLNKAQHLIDIYLFDSALKISNECIEFCNAKHYTSAEANAHNRMADIYYYFTDLPKMATHDSAALQIAKKLNDSSLISHSLNHLALYFSEKGNKTVAEKIFEEALSFVPQNEKQSLQADIYNNMGYMYALQSDVNAASDNYFRSLALYEKLNDKVGEAKTLDNLAGLYFDIGQNDKALYYQQQCIQIRANTNDHYGLAVTYSNLSQMYSAIDSSEKAFTFQQLGMQEAVASGSKKLIAQSHIALSLLYSAKREAKKSLDEELKAISILEEIGDSAMLTRRYIAAGIGYTQIDSVLALDYFNKSIAISQQLNSKENLRDAYAYINVLYREHKDFYNAYYNYRKYISYRDSIIKSETLSKIADIETKYETEKKDAQIKELSSEQIIQQLQLEKQKAIIKGNLLQAQEKQNEIDLLTKSRELQNLQIEQQEQELSKEKIQAQITEQKRKLAEQEKELKEKQLQNEALLRNFLIAAFLLLAIVGWILFSRYQLKKKLEQNNLLLKERSRISSELHDEVGSTLSTINILSHSAKAKLNNDPDKSNQLLEKINENSQHMMDAMSDIVWSINPANDDLNSVLVRIKEFVAEMLESKNIDYSITCKDEILQLKLCPEQKRDIYLVCKEAFNNLAKYSSATFASLDISKAENNIAITIEDNGKGFDIINGKKGNGLTNMQNRTKKHKGDIHIKSLPETGTTIHAFFPIA